MNTNIGEMKFTIQGKMPENAEITIQVKGGTEPKDEVSEEKAPKAKAPKCPCSSKPDSYESSKLKSSSPSSEDTPRIEEKAQTLLLIADKAMAENRSQIDGLVSKETFEKFFHNLKQNRHTPPLMLKIAHFIYSRFDKIAAKNSEVDPSLKLLSRRDIRDYFADKAKLIELAA